MDYQRDLTMTPDEITGWDELVKKDLALEEEVKTLTLKNMELTHKLEVYEQNGNIGVEGHNEEIVSFGPRMNEEEGAEWLGRRDHPLSNVVILKNLFPYVRRCDFLACRGVYHMNELTIPFTRSKFTLRIPQSRNPDEVSTWRIEDFVDVFSNNKSGIPFVKFILGPFCATDSIGQQFLKLCGDTTTELYLYQTKEGNEVLRVEDVSAILRSMSNLKKFSMSDKLVTESGNVVELFPGSKPDLKSLKSCTLVSCDRGNGFASCPTFLEELMRAAVKISAISVDDLWRLSQDDADEGISFHALSVIERLGRESSIQSLTLGEGGIKMRPHVALLRRMAEKKNGLKLKKLSFRVDFVDIDNDRDSEHFRSVEMFKDTLQDLEIFSFCSGFTHFPKMPKLRRLALNFYHHFNSGSVNLNKLFPILKELIVNQEGQEDDSIFEFLPRSDPCPTLTSLCLCRCDLRINEFNHILTTFPTLTKLVIQVKEYGPEILRQIWTSMTQLESLAIIGKVRSRESMDSHFTGIPPPAIREVSAALKQLDKMSVERRRKIILYLMNQHCRLPSIQNLTKLRRLTLGVTVCGLPGRPDSLKYISDVTGFLGFYSLKHLSHLSVCDTNLTKTCCEILRMEMEAGLESWEFTSVDDKKIIPPRKAEASDVYWNYWNDAQTLFF